jgi:nucleotide-binding universal stress UspA family protein
MKRILVPTDFSVTARQALIYAQKWAVPHEGASIHVVHMYTPAVEAEYPNVVPPIPEYVQMRENQLTDFVEECKAECAPELDRNVPITKEMIIGFPADEIVKLSENCDLIVMGTKGQTDLLDRWFGSVSSNVAKRAKCPTVLVPKGVSFKEIKQIVYAVNYESAEKEAIEQLLAINKDLEANVHFLHVAEEEDKEAFTKTKAELFEGLFEEGVPEFSFTMEEVPGDDISETISNYAVEHGIDLVVMATPQRSFWERFFHKSQSRKMALTTKLPLMIYHISG